MSRMATEMHRWELLSFFGTGAVATIALAALIITQTNGIRADMNSRFDRNDARFNSIEGRLTSMERDVADLRERTTRIETLLEYLLSGPANAPE